MLIDCVFVCPSDTRDLTLDINTAHKLLEISPDNKKATYTGNEHPYPDNPERFDRLAQVMCKEGLTGRCYWEVEWSGYPEAAVTYKEVPRKGMAAALGSDISWNFQQNADGDGVRYCPVHDHKFTNILGVYLDWCAGTLSYYKVSSRTLSHVYTFHTTFTQPLYPCFRVEDQNTYIFLSPVE
ncbi:hypothetical protein LDENG_00104600 [Lucifuga dentata]|nr:hypothetical protein LDENG_00104600 [Lucifuga dentata]